MKTLTLGILALLMASGSARSQSSFTGQDWAEWSLETRVFYMVGWVDGRAEGVHTAVREFRPELVESWSDADSPVQKLASKVTTGQIITGVTKFYEDYRNLHITIRSAVSLVFDDASGTRPITEERLQVIRRISSQSRK